MSVRRSACSILAWGPSIIVLAASLVLPLSLSSPARAADLDDYAPSPPPLAYGEPRYDGYRRPVERDYDGYVPEAPPPGYGPRADRGCVPRQAIRDGLERHGFSDFRDVALDGAVAHLRARRDNGRLYELSVDRCTGRLLEAHPAERRSADADDWRYRPDRGYDRAPPYPPDGGYGPPPGPPPYGAPVPPRDPRY